MTTTNESCPICSEGTLQHHIGKNRVEYKGKASELDTQYSVCSVCGSEQANANQLRINKRTMMAFKKEVDGLLAGAEVRNLRRRLRINQAEAAIIFGGGPVAFSKYESDSIVQSGAMDKLLRLALAVPDAFAYLSREASVEPDSANMWRNVEPVPPMHKPGRILLKTHPEYEQAWEKCA